MNQSDVIILGGGLVGQTLALALDVHGLSSAVVDRMPAEALLDSSYDGRVSAVASASWNMLNAMVKKTSEIQLQYYEHSRAPALGHNIDPIYKLSGEGRRERGGEASGKARKKQILETRFPLLRQPMSMCCIGGRTLA